jgi:hypothetical protein
MKIYEHPNKWYDYISNWKIDYIQGLHLISFPIVVINTSFFGYQKLNWTCSYPMLILCK